MPLFFHTINKKMFLKCVLWLKNNGYEFTSTDQLIKFLKGSGTVPDRAVWITFDDGWQENIDNVIPIIVEYNIPVTFFISTGPVENGGVFWWSYITKYGKYLPGNITIKKMRRVRESQRIELIKRLEDQFAAQMCREAMTVEQVQQIAELPQLEIGCHTVHHVMMTQCSDEQLKVEISTSKQKLESWIGKPVQYFSYPEGDYNSHVKQMIKDYGFNLAATTDNRFINDKDDLFSVPRCWVRGEGFFCETECQMLGIWTPVIFKIQKTLDINSYFKDFTRYLKNLLPDIIELLFAVDVVFKIIGI